MSVVVPLHNGAATIGRAIQSVLVQSYDDFTVTIVDDGSTDTGLAEVVRFTDRRIEAIRQENRGPGAARNRGARQSTSPLLAFLDADDEWEPGYLGTAIGRLEADPAVAAHASARFMGPDKKSTEERNIDLGIRPRPWRISELSRGEETSRYVNFLQPSCLVVRREVFERYGGFYEKNGCRFGEDTYLSLMFVINHVLFLDPKPLVWFHTEDSSLGVATRGRHPLRPALLEPEPLRANCDPSRREVLEDLLAYYRFRTTQQLAVQGRGAEIDVLRRQFPWRDRSDYTLRLRELKVDLRRFLGTTPLSWALRTRAKVTSGIRGRQERK